MENKINKPSRRVAKEFWEDQVVYPDYPFIKQRRFYELQYLVPKLDKVKTFLDLGCGDGALIKCLDNLTDIKIYYAYDYSDALLENVPRQKNIIVRNHDCYSDESLPIVDVTLLGGVIQYMFKDSDVIKLLQKINSKTVYIRSACSLDGDVNVNSYSEKLKSDYASYYRELGHTLKLLNQVFNVVDVVRIYPDEIESKFGTKQYYFKCIKK